MKPLEGLKDATRDLNHIDRSDIYYQLLLSYIKQDDADKSLGLWTQMQEEDLPPTDQFLLKLGSFLQEKGMPVPFAMPQPRIIQRPVTIGAPALSQQPSVGLQRPRPTTNPFKRKLTAGDLDGCLQTLNNEKVSVSDISLLIEKLVHGDRLDDATKVTLDLLNKGTYPVQKIFR